jgi:integrase
MGQKSGRFGAQLVARLKKRYPGVGSTRIKGKDRLRLVIKSRHIGYLKSEPFSPAFDAEYQALISGEGARQKQRGIDRIIRGSFADLTIRYFASAKFKALKPSSQYTFRGILERFVDDHGKAMIFDLRRHHLMAIMSSMADRPGAANSLLARLKVVLEFGVEIEMLADNPARGVKSFPRPGEGHHAWTEGEIAQFQECHPTGTKARLALELFLGTGQRLGDVRRMGWRHVRPGCISLVQEKTGKSLTLPIIDDLGIELRRTNPADETFLMTAYGRPFTSAGFGGWFRKQCDRAELPQCSAHGLRKAVARRMAEAGCSANEIAAVTGHASLKEVATYTRSADQERLAERAMDKVASAKREQIRLTSGKLAG